MYLKIVVTGILLFAGCAAQTADRSVDYLCGDPPGIEVTAEHLRANSGVRLSMGDGMEMGIAVGTSSRVGNGRFSLSLGKRFTAREKTAVIEWPDGTRMTCTETR